MNKMVTVIRKDLNMRRGKQIAQAQHASMKVIFDRLTVTLDKGSNGQDIVGDLTPAMLEWLTWEPGQQGFTKIVVGCDGGEEEILSLEKQANDAGIPCAVITDNGLTEFHGNPTITCIAIGPDDADKIDGITGDYKLL